MTNTASAPGAHRTDDPIGVVIRTHPHRRGYVARSAGEINRAAWSAQAELTRADVAFRREYRDRRADYRASLERLGLGGRA